MPQIQAVNPYHQALQTGLQDYMNITKSAYQPATMQAEIASKNAYAQNLTRQIVASVLANPLAIATMSNEQRNGLLGMLMPGKNASNGTLSNQAVAGSSLWDKLKNWTGLSNNNSEQPNAQMQPQNNEQPSAPAQSNPSSNTSIYTPNSSGIDLTDPRMNLYNKDFGSPQANAAAAQQYPSPYQKFETEKIKASLAQGAREQGAAMQKLNDEALASSGSAIALQKSLDAFHTHYKNANLTGPALGWAAAWGPESGQLQGLSTEMQTSAAAQIFGSKLTNYKEQLAKDLKLNASMRPEAEQGAYDRLRAGTMRVQEYDDFVAAAQNMGVNDPNKIKRLWNHYNLDMPFYNGKTLQVINENLNKGTEYLQSSLKGSSTTAKSSSESNNSTQNNNAKLSISPQAKMLANKIKLPQFESKEAAQKWYANQSRISKDAIIYHLQNKGND